jgi:hypothetical protein
VKTSSSALMLAACAALGGCYYAPYPYYGYYATPLVPADQANIETVPPSSASSQPYGTAPSDTGPYGPPDTGYALVPPPYPVYAPYPVYPAYPYYPGYYAGPVFSFGFGFGHGGGHGWGHGGGHWHGEHH